MSRYHDPYARRCPRCGAVLAHNIGPLCRPCERTIRPDPPAHMDRLITLVENASDLAIERVADIVMGRRATKENW